MNLRTSGWTPSQRSSRSSSDLSPEDKRVKSYDSPHGSMTDHDEDPEFNQSMDLTDTRDPADIVVELNKTMQALFENFTREANEKILAALNQNKSRLDAVENDVKVLKEENKLHLSKENLDAVNKRIDELEIELLRKSDELEQYGRRNALRFKNIHTSRIPKTETGDKVEYDTDTFIIDFCQEFIGIEIPRHRISRSHIVGKIINDQCTILVKFTTYNMRNTIYNRRLQLKDKCPGVFIEEDLTKYRRKCLGVLLLLKKKGIISSAWSHDGRILYKVDVKGKVSKISVINEILARFRDVDYPNWVYE